MLDKNRKYLKPKKFENFFALGRQLTIEYYDCGKKKLLDKNDVEQALLNAARKSGATIISSSFHDFNPQGISGVVVIAESHFTVHAWPEHDYAAVDIFTCGDNIDLEIAINAMKDSFESGNVVISSDQNRGIIAKPFEQKDVGTTLGNTGLRPISWLKDYEEKSPWGVLTSIDIYQCDPEMVRDAKRIKSFGYDLCSLVKVKPNGECRVEQVETDEKTAGFILTLPLETLMISGRFIHASNTVYLDILCSEFHEPRDVAEFAVSFFKGDNYKMQIALRQ